MHREELDNFVETVRKYRERVDERKKVLLDHTTDTPLSNIRESINGNFEKPNKSTFVTDSINISVPGSEIRIFFGKI